MEKEQTFIKFGSDQVVEEYSINPDGSRVLTKLNFLTAKEAEQYANFLEFVYGKRTFAGLQG